MKARTVAERRLMPLQHRPSSSIPLNHLIGNILESHPSMLTDGSSGIWYVSAVVTNNNSEQERVSLSAYAMCVNIAPSASP